MFILSVKKYLNLLFIVSLIKRIQFVKGVLNEVSQSNNDLKITEEEAKRYNIWPIGVIPYYIDDVSYDKVLRDEIRAYLATVSSVTYLEFVEMSEPPVDKSSRYVMFINRRGVLDCVDYTNKDFTSSGVQKVIVGYNCVDSASGSLAATILALAGIPPQHNAPNRDQYIKVNIGNVLADKKDKFTVQSDWPFKDALKYDFESAGHYGPHKFTASGGATIELKDGVGSLKSEPKSLSSLDIQKIQLLYSDTHKKKDELQSKKICNQLINSTQIN